MNTGKVIGKSLDVLIGGANLALAIEGKEVTDKLGHLVWDLGNDATPAQFIRVYYAVNVAFRLLNLYSDKTRERLAGVSSLLFTGLYATSFYEVACDYHNKMNWARFGLDLATLSFNAFVVNTIYSNDNNTPSQSTPSTVTSSTQNTIGVEDSSAKYFSLTDRLKGFGRKAVGLVKDKTTEYAPIIQRTACAFY